MTRYRTVPGGLHADAVERDLMLNALERAEIEPAIEAVCAEVGLGSGPDERRARIAYRIAFTWRNGRRLPLNLVSAGLDAVGV
jgi:hypothetical protein